MKIGGDPAALAGDDLELTTKGLDRLQFFFGKGVGGNGFEPIAFYRTDKGEGGTRTAPAILYHRHTGAEIAPLFGLFDDRQRHPVLIRAGGVEVFELDEYQRTAGWRDL